MEALIDQIHQSSFYEFAALLTLAGFIGVIGLILRQPMVVCFIAVGVLAGPSALGLVHSTENIQLLAQLGIAILLFLVGLKLDLKLIKTLGPVALATGLGQVAFTSAIGFGIGLALGLDTVTSIYVAVALTFSSTIIIVKLLSDKNEVDSLHGRIAVGFLIVQDLVVVLAMMVLSALGIGASGEGGSPFIQIGKVLLYGAAMLIFVLLFIRYVANSLMAVIARSPELMITFAIAWAALLAALGSYLGLSKELGGLLAGISLASTPFREAIIARLSALRDFLLLFFFIALGSQLDLGLLGAQIGPALVFSIFVLIGNPLIVLIIMSAMGYRKRTGFLAGLTVAQISEFSLIFMAMGFALGHVTTESLGLVTLVGLITISLSVYMISYSHTLYRWLAPALSIFERKNCPSGQPDDTEEEAASMSKTGYDVIVFGLGRYGQLIVKDLLAEGYTVLAVDFNPEEVKRWRALGHAAIYGDACDPEFYYSLPLKKAQWVISALPQRHIGITHQDPRKVIVRSLKDQGFKGKIAVACHDEEVAQDFKSRGADQIFLPFHDAADRAVNLLREYKTS